MSSKESNSGKPKTFGEKFKEDGLIGMLKKKKTENKSKATPEQWTFQFSPKKNAPEPLRLPIR